MPARPRAGLQIHSDGPRLCLPCIRKRIPEDRFGAWTYGWGECTCGHFGITTLEEHVLVVEGNIGAVSQQELLVAEDDGLDRA